MKSWLLRLALKAAPGVLPVLACLGALYLGVRIERARWEIAQAEATLEAEREKALVYQRLRLMDAALREAARVSSEKAEASRLATEDRRRGDARIKAGEARLAKLIEGGAPFDREASAELMDRERAAGLR